MKRSVIQEFPAGLKAPDFTSLHPGYENQRVVLTRRQANQSQKNDPVVNCLYFFEYDEMTMHVEKAIQAYSTRSY